jgi:O-6-methylguanine DNA methyltransferase
MRANDLYALVRLIPPGKVTTYQRLAVVLGFPHHARQVGQLLKRNPTPLVVPCHRVIAASGKVSGYFGVAAPLVKGHLTRGELAIYLWQP